MSLHYISQLDYPNIEYCTGTENGDLSEEFNTFDRSGCGVCCFIMGVEALTGKRIPINEAIQFAKDSGATDGYGTQLELLFAYAAPKYDLSYEFTNDIEVLQDRLKAGAIAIANTGGDRDGYKCPFSPRGHYIFIVDINDEHCTIFDTACRQNKYDKWIENGDVEMLKQGFIKTKTAILDRACDNKTPRYCILKKK